MKPKANGQGGHGMAAIEKRTAQDGTVTYRVKVRLRGQPVQSASFSSLTKAKQWGTQKQPF